MIILGQMVLKGVNWVHNTKSSNMLLRAVNWIHNVKSVHMVLKGVNLLHNDKIRLNCLERSN